VQLQHNSPSFSSSSFTVGLVGFATVGTAAFRLIVPTCFGRYLSSPPPRPGGRTPRTDGARGTMGEKWPRKFSLQLRFPR
jgi:hypothetical protein